MTRIGRHIVRRTLSSNGLVSSYRALHDQDGTVQLNVLGDDHKPTAAAVDQFSRDATIACKLRIAGVLDVVDWGTADHIHVSTSSITARPLRDVVSELPGNRLEFGAAVELGLKLAEALETIHVQGLVHAGVSDRSVLIGATGEPLLTDLAMGRLLASMSHCQPEILSDLQRGLAPEQVSAPDRVCRETDVFLLGVVLYRASTGHEPFERVRRGDRCVEARHPLPIDERGIALPHGFIRLVTRMLSWDPLDRPSTASVAARLRFLAADLRETGEHLGGDSEESDRRRARQASSRRSSAVSPGLTEEDEFDGPTDIWLPLVTHPGADEFATESHEALHLDSGSERTSTVRLKTPLVDSESCDAAFCPADGQDTQSSMAAPHMDPLANVIVDPGLATNAFPSFDVEGAQTVLLDQGVPPSLASDTPPVSMALDQRTTSGRGPKGRSRTTVLLAWSVIFVLGVLLGVTLQHWLPDLVGALMRPQLR